ncbi:PrpF domain-containing protein [Geomicrobium sp. JSM 1781026]|uniref:PrpF domain-containing protein n=1 Tax=Geomicrobium sp. JSM 1781026 TaxID=3344580 RepID=UPI0035BECFF4
MQKSVPCSVYRGGTSRGVFFKEEDLPRNDEQCQNIFYQALDTKNTNQINGLGSGTSHTSKVMVVGTSLRENTHIEFTFYQIGIGQSVADPLGTCGNLMAAVGAFAVNENMLDIDAAQNEVIVRAYNTNTDRHVHITVPVIKGNAQVSGSYHMPGVVGKGAEYQVKLIRPGGGKLGQTLPLGGKCEEDHYEVTLSDIVNPFVFLDATEFGLRGNESVAELANNHQLLRTIEGIRQLYSVRSGLTKTVEEAKQYQSIPKVALLAPPMDYTTNNGERVSLDQVDVTARMVSMGMVHKTFAGSGLYNLAGTALLEGTLPSQIIGSKQGNSLRIGHPGGVISVTADTDGKEVEAVMMSRTARLIMRGELFYTDLY